jgi:hypothetical protein
MVSVFFIFSTLLFSSLALVSGHLVKTSEPSSQSLLSDAAAGCMFDSVNGDGAMLCDNLLASLLPLSAHLLTEVLFLNLAYLQDSVSTLHMLAVLYSLS